MPQAPQTAPEDGSEALTITAEGATIEDAGSVADSNDRGCAGSALIAAGGGGAGISALASADAGGAGVSTLTATGGGAEASGTTAGASETAAVTALLTIGEGVVLSETWPAGAESGAPQDRQNLVPGCVEPPHDGQLFPGREAMTVLSTAARGGGEARSLPQD